MRPFQSVDEKTSLIKFNHLNQSQISVEADNLIDASLILKQSNKSDDGFSASALETRNEEAEVFTCHEIDSDATGENLNIENL